MDRKIGMRLFALLLCAAMLAGCAGQPKKDGTASLLDPEKPLTITVWNYYNGQQLAAFNEIVEQFNTTQGRELGIVVESYSQGSVSDLETNVLAAARGQAGAEKIPNIFAAYVDSAYALNKMGMVADVSPYLSEEEQKLYIDSYIEEGRFAEADSIKIFPMAKSTEVFILNETDWQKFAAATGASYSDFATMEGLVATAERYYNWTDSLTPDVPDDGKAFFGRDAMANYMLIGAMQLGTELFSVSDGKMTLNFDRDTVRKLWDNYYVPFVQGYFAASGRFRSDDIKTGHIIALVGSSSGATFFPKQVIVSDTESYDIQSRVLPVPQFAGNRAYAVQQGAGMVVTKGTDAEVYASVQFLKWMTQGEHNVTFATSSGYLPVTWEANDMDYIRAQVPELSGMMEEILTVGVETVHDNTMYTPKAFANGADARQVLEYSLQDQAKADRDAVEAAMAEGVSREEACAPYLTDAQFDAWYTQTLAKLQKLEG